MPRYKTVDPAEIELVLRQANGLEPIIVDDKLVAIEVKGVRIYPSRGDLLVSKRED